MRLFLGLVSLSVGALLADRAIAIEPPTAAQVAQQSGFGTTLGGLPAFTKDFRVTLPKEAQEILKVTEIVGKAGQKPVDTLPFSVWHTAFGAGDLSLGQGAKLLNIPTADLSQAALSNFKFLSTTSVKDFITANPQLAKLRFADLPAGLLPSTLNLSTSTRVPATLGQIAQSPLAATAKLGNLDKIAASKIPGLLDRPLKSYPQIFKLPASKIPFVSNLKITQFPQVSIKIQAGIPLATIDTVFKGEKRTRKVISGSKQQPNAVCTGKCDYVELLGIPRNPLTNGATIVSGDSQSVKGGENFPGNLVNGGKEPPGIHPFGDAFKLVFTGVNPKTNTVQTNLNFRVCWSMFFYTTCTPYFIQIPFMSLKGGTGFPLLLGNVSVPMEPKLPKIK